VTLRASSTIAGVFVRDLRWIADDRGALTELYRDSWEVPPCGMDEARLVAGGILAAIGSHDGPHLYSTIENVGRAREVYLTETREGLVKAWHFHRCQTDRFTAVRGTLRVVLYDDRANSPTRGGWHEVVLDPDRAHRQLLIPPGVVHGWKNIGQGTAAILNCVTDEWNNWNDEFRRGPHDGPAEGVPFDWHARADG
jgi:dTDP-4-dehydrorhamnose 3,5-epimerase